MKASLRRRFDRLLEEVLAELPEWVHDLLAECPLVVDDAPTAGLLAQAARDDVAEPHWLCGLYSGIPLTERSVAHSGTLPETIHIFRVGIWESAADDAEDRTQKPIDALADVPDQDLLRQIRVTVLHEIGHHFGLEETDLRRLGYE